MKRAQAAHCQRRLQGRNRPGHGQGPQGRGRRRYRRGAGQDRPAKIPTLRAAFGKDGVLTAASSSKISDGAAATRADVRRRSRQARAQAAGAHRRPCHAMPRHRSGSPPRRSRRSPTCSRRPAGRVADVDLFEVNEAFACVAMAPMKDLGIPHDKINVNGGACALGHPIGASGARLVVTLLNALRTRGGKRGVASLCIGGGEATAVALRVDCKKLKTRCAKKTGQPLDTRNWLVIMLSARNSALPKLTTRN